MRLFLHIGTPKTGTTTLQRWCASHRAGLAAQGVWYPESLGAESHRKLAAYARDSARAEDARLGIRSPEDHAAFRARLEAAFDAEAAGAAGARACLVSCEILWSRINTPAEIERLRAFLAPRFAGLRVVLHLRPQVDLLLSNASQLARLGTEVTEAELMREGIGPRNGFYGYDRTVAAWEGVFGPEALTIVPFRRVPDITAHLIGLLGIDAAALPAPVRVNRGLDWRTIALANALRRGFAELGVPVPPWPIDDMPGAERLSLGRARAEALHARFAAGNAALAARRPDITEADLTPDWAQHPAEGNVGLLDAPCFFAPQIAHLVRRLAQERAVETWRRHQAEGRLAALAGDAAGMARAQRAAERAWEALERLGLPLPEEAAAEGAAVGAPPARGAGTREEAAARA